MAHIRKHVRGACMWGWKCGGWGGEGCAGPSVSERGYAEADDVSERAVEVSGWGTGGIVSKGECHAYTRALFRGQ